MKVLSKSISLNTKREMEIINITERIEKILFNSGLSEGIVSLFAVGSTCALTTIEFEPGLLKDFPAFLEKIIPKNASYEHELAWHDGNGHSHVKAALLKPDLVVPFQNRKMCLGTWQQIVLIELNPEPRERKVIMQILGE